ncbi:MAG: CDP-diacylglycerol diphosphatase [Pantoea sp.]|uniref:CDP-diacylglycerol pyrophosphatase n=1 Tax=Pantoea septica TaxID=472695 RepID=A0ABX3UTD4_9GAMM|nr:MULTISPECIES: CDP-diacylglycerol diphosphatase [Pantoea]MDU5782417.1 CDP-diacylglycerol diphosphatase [Pantoea sp.]ORN00324.1 CDP-diacylglycerol diphosphatase [Pantoea septica]
MQGRRRAPGLIALLLLILISGLAIAAFHLHKNSDALWHIVSEKCEPNQRATGKPAPCQRVELEQGYVLLKDLNGPLQYLLIPLAKISGMESPALLNPATPNFFAFAWQARAQLAAKRGAPVADSALSLAINAEYGRTQNQLHIHISCLRPDVRRVLDRLAPVLSSRWQTERLRQHAYRIRALTLPELTQQSLFIRVANEIPNARGEMGKYGLALAALPDGRLAVLALERNWLLLNRGSAEELQDHSCEILRQ